MAIFRDHKHLLAFLRHERWATIQHVYHESDIANKGGSITKDDGLEPGDLLFYSWWGDGHVNHVCMQGQDQQTVTPFTGDSVDCHTADHWKAWWGLYPYMMGNPEGDFPGEGAETAQQERQRTEIYAVHITR